MPQDPNPKFPKNFLWGASTSSHQVEGGNHNQWTVWELAHASELAKDVNRSNNPLVPPLNTLASWNDIKSQVKDPANYISGKGVDHFHRYKEDFDLLQQLNFNSFRFGIEWSRIEPQEGEWDLKAIDHYKTYIKELKSRGLEPVMNIWHWTNPVWFEEKGAFTKRKNLKYFQRFVAKVSQELCQDVSYVLTINEANSYSSFSYFLGVWPPQQKSIPKMLAVYYNLMLCHKRAYKLLKKTHPKLKVGVAHQATANTPKNRFNPLDVITASLSNYYWQGWFYRRIAKYQDFVGMNFYFKNYWSWFAQKNPADPRNDLGWYMEPRAVGQMAEDLYRKYKKPVIITESGVADAKDQYRQWWLEETIAGMQDALANGADIKGYFHWSLLDNFEWAEGWWPKFGLVEVDREHGMKRTIRPSAKWFAEHIAKLSATK